MSSDNAVRGTTCSPAYLDEITDMFLSLADALRERLSDETVSTGVLPASAAMPIVRQSYSVSTDLDRLSPRERVVVNYRRSEGREPAETRHVRAQGQG